MARKLIFLSYRRDDIPGYVSRLENELESAFGTDCVFRDVQDIPGGKAWWDEIQRALRQAKVFILVIGPRWKGIWAARNPDDDHLRLELRTARSLGVPIVPVTLGGENKPWEVELGEFDWLPGLQWHDISDVQRRWSGDVESLVQTLERSHGLRRRRDGGRRRQGGGARRSAWWWLAVPAAVVLGALLLWGEFAPVPMDLPREAGFEPTPPRTGSDAGFAGEVDFTGADGAAAGDRPAPPAVGYPIPDIAGLWIGQDGTEYYVDQFDDGTLQIHSPGYGDGEGWFLPDMPNKIAVVMYGIGSGEFAISTTGERMGGWILVDGRQEFDTLRRAR